MVSEEHKRKISESIKKHWETRERKAWNKGLKTPVKVKEKQRQAKLKNPVKYWQGKKRHPKTICAMQEGLKNYEIPKKSKHHCWKGGTSTHWRKEARKIMSAHLGRELKSTEIIHHIDGNYKNNSVENLMITNRAEHIKIHLEQGDINPGRRT